MAMYPVHRYQCSECLCFHDYVLTFENEINWPHIRCKCLDDPKEAAHRAACAHGKCEDTCCAYLRKKES